MFPDKIDKAKYTIYDLPEGTISYLEQFSEHSKLKELMKGTPRTIDEMRECLASVGLGEWCIREMVKIKKVKEVLGGLGD